MTRHRARHTHAAHRRRTALAARRPTKADRAYLARLLDADR